MKKGAVAKLAKFVRRQEKAFKVNMIRSAGNTLFNGLTDQFRSLYILRLGATAFELGLVNSIAGTAATAIALPTGWFADRHGIRRVFLLGSPLIILGSLLFALALDWRLTIPAMLLTLLANQLFHIACPMVCGSYLKSEERATGKQLCDTVSLLPTLVAPMVAAVLISNFGGLNSEGIRPLYFLQTFGFSLVALFTYKYYFDPCKSQSCATRSNFTGELGQVFGKGTAVKEWTVFFFLSSSTYFMSLTYLPAFITEIKHGDEFIVGGVTAASMMLTLLLALPLGRAADTFGRKKVLYATIPLYCASILLLIYAENATMLLISGALQGFYLLSAVTQGAITAELVPVSHIGKWYGILNLCRGLSSIVAPLVGGLIWSIIGAEYVFFFIVLTEASRLTILLMLIPETLPKKRVPEAQ